MLPELAESRASGETARIYGEMRRLTAVPYVSSMQRHLATRPGWLAWAWGAVRPAFADGSVQTAVWRLAAAMEAPPLDPIGRPALRLFGLGPADEAVLRSICDNFIRVSPTNIAFGGILKWLLAGNRPRGLARPHAHWQPPSPLDPFPALLDLDALTPPHRAVVMAFAETIGGDRFVPGLYRLTGTWPGLAAHLATVLVPRIAAPSTASACARLLGEIDAALPALCEALPAPPPPPGSATEIAEVVAALETYRGVSPQLVLFATLIRDALPPPA